MSTQLHLLAHLEHVGRAALRLRRGVQHELHRLRDQHEEPAHLGMGDRDRPALRICSRKRGTTLPLLPRTLPKRTIENEVPLPTACAWTTSSASRFDAPITLVGFTALSVEIKMKRSTP